MDTEALAQAAGIADPIERARELERLMKAAADFSAEAARIRRAAIAQARAQGLTTLQIADALGVSRGRIRQIPADETAGPAPEGEP